MIRLNLGSGRHPWPNAINKDYDERADMVGPVTELPEFEDGSVDEIYAIHLFEHLDRMKIDPVLAEWNRVLKVGGKLVIEVPCLDKIAQLILNGVEDCRLTLFGIFGDIREPSPYMLHKWCYTEKELSRIISESGFSVVVSEPIYHIKARDMRITGVKR